MAASLARSVSNIALPLPSASMSSASERVAGSAARRMAASPMSACHVRAAVTASASRAPRSASVPISDRSCLIASSCAGRADR
ncbi:hypothetical protein FOHLNKBM_2752 [Methylobacterium longum]|nr:hypothetical protein FOHLNKBM_2752 [Methylobacterium longum]